LRKELNDSLAQKRFDDAVAAARQLRDILKSKPRLDPRELKSLAGAESVLRRFAEEGSTRVGASSRQRKWIAIAVGMGLALFVALTLFLATSRGDTYVSDASRALDALDKVDSTVSSAVGWHDYERVVLKSRTVCSAFLTRYADTRKGEVAYQAIAASQSIYDKVLAEWQKGAAAGKRLSTSDLTTPVDYPHMWLAAHTLEACALSVVTGKGAPMAAHNATTPLARLEGHWSDGKVDLYYGPLNPSTGLGWFVSRSHRLEMGAYEQKPKREEPVVNQGTSISASTPGAAASPSPTPVVHATTSAPLRPDEVEIIRYVPGPVSVTARVTTDAYTERYSNINLVRYDDKTLP
jgi:hypothetical protein